jgi:hypothetical protein
MLRESCFPGSISSNEGHALPSTQLEMNPAKNGAVLVMKPEILGFDHRTKC